MLARSFIPVVGVYYSSAYLTENLSLVFWISLTIFGLVGLFELGFTPTFTRYFSIYGLANSDNCSSRLDVKKVKSLVEMQSLVYFRLAVFFMITTSILLVSIVWPHLSEFSHVLQAILFIAFVCLGATSTLISSKYKAILSGLGQIRRQKVIEACFGVATVCILVAVLDLGILTVFGSFFVLRLAELFLLERSAKRFLERLAGKESCYADPFLKKEIFNASLKSGFGVLATAGTIEGCAILSAFLFEAGVAANYISTQRFAIMLGGFAYLPFQVSIPSFVAMYSSGERKLLLVRARSISWVVLSLVVLGGAIAYYGSIIGSKITPYEFSFDQYLWWSLVFYALIERAGAINIQLQTLNRVVNWHKANGLAGIGILLLIFPMSHLFGPLGFVFSFIISYLFLYFPYSVYLKTTAFPNVSAFYELITPIPFIVSFLILILLL